MRRSGVGCWGIAWWLTTFSGLAIALTLLGFNFSGAWLRDSFDPHG